MSPIAGSPDTANSPLRTSAETIALLKKLHHLSLEQHAQYEKDKSVVAAQGGFKPFVRDKFVALEEDKCLFVYQLLLASGAKTIVEAGTSFGVSTIYLALAVIANGGGKVIATEHEPTKVTQAHKYWTEAGVDIHRTIELREGDLLKTLSEDLPQIDALLLDIWTPMALPTLQIVRPNLRDGATIIADNTISAASGYTELLAYIDDDAEHFSRITVPYEGGLELIVYRR